METLLKITNTQGVAKAEIRDAIKLAPMGSLLIYYRGPVGLCSREVIRDAREASHAAGELCQRPTQSYDRRGYRIWDYMIQKHGDAA
jgi:hypothetical protein